jgi:rRNA maturation endonuclease Nob1
VSAVLFTPHLEEESEETSESIEVSEQEAVLQSPVARVLAYRVNCDTCGTPINPKWPECPVCGGKFYVPAEKAHYEGIDAALQKHRRAGQ